MKSLGNATRLALVAISVYVASISPGLSANFFQDAWGVVTDPLKLRQASSTLSDSLERSLIQLGALEATGNYDAQQRLEQIRSILHDVIGGTDNTISLATNNMLELESSINADAIKLIYRAQCASEVVLMNQFQRSFAQLMANLQKADPSIRLGGIRIIDLTANNITIDDPDQAYISTKSAVIAKLQKDVTDNSKAYEILSAYQNLEMAAKFTRCYYLDQALDKRFVQEVNELERQSLPWVMVVTPTM
jgi:hypothetical protein